MPFQSSPGFRLRRSWYQRTPIRCDLRVLLQTFHLGHQECRIATIMSSAHLRRGLPHNYEGFNTQSRFVRS